MTRVDNPPILAAATALANGEPVCVFDAADREGETDLFYLAASVTAADIARLRNDAGGLVFMAIDPALPRAVGLPLLEDMLVDGAAKHPVLGRLVPKRLPYDARSSFGITINHREAFTGITDEDRARTVSAVGRLMAELPGLDDIEAADRFVAEFRAPGHVALCYGAVGGLSERRGHTELGLALARLAGVPGALVGAEMLTTGKALSRADAEDYAARHGIPFLDGAEIEAAWATLKADMRNPPVTA